MAILFGGSNRSQSKSLVEFRAGKMNLVGTTVHPDKRKGLLYVYQADDALMHFCWKDRGSGVVEDDLIIFPDDVEYKRIAQCTTGRAYLLKFKSSSRRIFFWMQEPKTEKDDEYVKKINDLLNNPPPLGSSRSGGSTPGADMSNIGLETLLSGDTDLQSLISGMNQQQLRQLLGAANLGNIISSSTAAHSTTPATTAATPAPSVVTTSAASSRGSTATTPTSSSQMGTIQLSQLQNILSGIRVPATDGSQSQEASPHIDLAAMNTTDVIQPILSNPEFIERLQSMLPQTGEQVSTSQQIRETLQSPQFQQALSSFSAAMQSGQLAPLMNQFGLRQEPVRAAAQGADMESFVRALQAALQERSEQSASSKEKEGDEPKTKDDDDDENMALD